MIGNDEVHTPVEEAAAPDTQVVAEAPVPDNQTPAAPEDAFAAAFDRMTAPGEEPREEIPAPVEPVAAVAEEPTSTLEEEPTSPPVEEPKLSDAEILSRFAELVKGQPQQEAPPQPPPQQQYAQEPPQYYSAEDLEVLKKYEEEFPEVSRAEAIRRSAEYKQLVGYVFQEVAKEFSPIVEQIQSLATRTHLTDLQTTVPDYADVRDKVIDWANSPSQPPYLRAAYNHVIQHGTVDEVSDLIARFRTETQVATPAPSQPRRARTPDLPPATKQAVAALAPVSSKRSAVIQGIESADFDAAFESFANRRAS